MPFEGDFRGGLLAICEWEKLPHKTAYMGSKGNLRETNRVKTACAGSKGNLRETNRIETGYVGTKGI